ncbi:RNA-binding protein, putative [Bodo saltans]|uniref:RNA-binding protein, putative n=1 Tax=Bodo saltans TaxID=75058 RepID=A0A0S4JNS6_BODSA|nr:RNA-binding protein, putative [Bodo saltans]|eukprot:CUG91882.1 RNA-binding protein, putative [Bodo saltans]
MLNDDATSTVAHQNDSLLQKQNDHAEGGSLQFSPDAFRVEGTEASLATAMSGVSLTGETGGNDNHPDAHQLSTNFGEAPYPFSTTGGFVPKSRSPAATPDAPIIYPELPPARNFSETQPTRKYSENTPSKRSSELTKNFAELPPSRNTSGNRSRRSGTPKVNADGTDLPALPNGPPAAQNNNNANDSSARNLYVSSLPNQFSTQQLYQMFAPFGTVLSARFMPPKGAAPPPDALPPTNTSGEPLPPDSTNFRGFGFVCYEKEEDANRAMLSMIGTIIGGSKIQVRPSRRHSDGGHISTPQQQAPVRNNNNTSANLSQRSGGGGGVHQSQSSMGGSGSVHPSQMQQMMMQQQQQQAILGGSGQTTFLMNTIPTGPQFIQVAPGAMNYMTTATPMQSPMGQYVMHNGGGAATFFTQAPGQQLGYTATLSGSGSLQGSAGGGAPTMVATPAGMAQAQYFTPGAPQWIPQQLAMQPQAQPGSLGGSGGAVDFGAATFYTAAPSQGAVQSAYGQAQSGMFVMMPPPYQM